MAGKTTKKAAANRKTATKSARSAKKAAAKSPHRPESARRGPRKRVAAKPTLLAGGNPQIAKADGDVPVQAYIAAMPGWKRDVGHRLDALIVRTSPGVRKAVKWNSPFYGIEGQGWFLNFHCFTNYVKVAFFRGTALRPVPPGESKHKDVRYLDIREDDPLDEAQMATWIRQAGCPARLGPVAPAPPSRFALRRAGGILARHRSPGVNTMAGKTSTNSAKIATKAAAKAPHRSESARRGPRKRVAAKAAKPRNAVAKASAHMSASKRIDKRIADLGDWRGERLAEIRTLIHEVDPEVVEEWKWMGSPVWSHDGMYALANAHKDKVKLTFFHGAELPDPTKLFNAGRGGNTWRAIDFREGDTIDKTALKALLREAVAYNTTHSVPKSKGSRA